MKIKNPQKNCHLGDRKTHPGSFCLINFGNLLRKFQWFFHRKDIS